MTGLRPSTSGIYGNDEPLRLALPDAVTLPTCFMNNGYLVKGSGKIFHGWQTDAQSWHSYWPSMQRIRPRGPKITGRPLNGIPDTGSFDWGPIDLPDEEMPDWQVADWVAGELTRGLETPFFLGFGIYRPHVPWFVPREYFDMYPLDRVTLPEVNENDLDDIPPRGVKIALANADHKKILATDNWHRAVQAYLASVSFADACVGRVLDALDASPHADNTIVVLWGDHGWHAGEKLHWRKFALWEEATRSPLMFVVPGTTTSGSRCTRPVSLLDIYPTLLELCGIDASRLGLEGNSLVMLLENPRTPWKQPALTTFARNDHSLRSERWRYIRYRDGSEELYDHEHDALEWTNLAADPHYAPVKADLARWLPKVNAERAPTSV